MFDTDLERTVVGRAIPLWFAHGWYLNTRLERVHKKLDQVLETFDGLRKYLNEIDPQFDDKRESANDFEEDSSMFAGMADMELIRWKEEQGKHTLNSPFLDGATLE